jgi:hypothetical protein
VVFFGMIYSCLHSQASVWTNVVTPPILHDNASCTEIIEYLAAQIFSAEFIMKAFHVSVLPRAAWIDIKGLDCVFFASLWVVLIIQNFSLAVDYFFRRRSKDLAFGI